MEKGHNDEQPSYAFVKYGSLFLNVVSSVGVIFINKKLVFIEAGFRFGIMLTVIHFAFSFLGCVLFAKMGYFNAKQLSIVSVFPISVAFCGYVVFNNLSLLSNTVSVYQMSKIICTPVIVWIDYACYSKHEQVGTLLSLVPVCLGVVFTVCTDANLNIMGSIWAIFAVVANSLYTVWGKRKQEELGASAMQLLLYQAPLSAVMLVLALPLDDFSSLMAYKMTFPRLFAIALSCLFAFGVNFSFFLFVGQTSPLTMNVLGYLKTALVFIGGSLFFSSEVSTKMAFGILLTLVGLALYTHCKIREKMSYLPAKSIG